MALPLVKNQTSKVKNQNDKSKLKYQVKFSDCCSVFLPFAFLSLLLVFSPDLLYTLSTLV